MMPTQRSDSGGTAGLPPEIAALSGGAPTAPPQRGNGLPDDISRLLAEQSAATQAPASQTTAGRAARDLLGGAADVIDLGTIGLPAMAAGTAIESIRRVSGAIRGEDRRRVAAEGAALSGKIGEQFGTPIRTTLTNLGILRKDEPGAIPQALETLMGKVEEGAKAVESGTNSWILKEDVMMTFNGLLGALGIKGIGAGTKAVMKAGELRRANADIQKQLAAAEGERLGREVVAGEKLAEAEAINRPVEIRADTPQAVSDIAKAERKLRAQKRADVRAAFAGDPSMTAADRSSAGWELSEADRTQLQAEGMAEARERARAEAEGLSNMGERAPRTGYREGAELDLNAPIERPITTPDGTPFGTAEQMATQQGLERRGLADTLGRGDQGKLIPNADALNSGLAKVRGGRLFDLTSEERVALRGSSRITDPKVITAAAVGATGLGLALTMEPSAEEAALAIGAGALAVGRGRGPLTLEAIRSMPDAAPHKVFKDASPYTLSTLEMLPENAFDFSKTQVQQLLKRQEVTKMERGILESALAAVPGDRITAKQLWTGVKEATGDFELKRKDTDQFAPYGLENIGRIGDIVERPHPTEPGVWIQDSSDITPPSRTTIYQSPVELGTANHFNDPNYFAHTRSFDEDGVKHVVELQSDVAQKAKIETITPEMREAIDRSNRRQDGARRFWDRVQYATGRAGNYSLFDGLRTIKRTEADLNAVVGHNDIPRMIEEKLHKNLNEAGQEGSYLADKFYQEWAKGKTPQEIANYERGYVDISEGFIDWALKHEREFSSDVANVLRGVLNRYAATKLDDIAVIRRENESKLQTANIAQISPMLKDWHKRLIREEIAASAREADPAARARQLETARVDLAQAEAALAEVNRPREWTRVGAARAENLKYELDVAAMDLRNRHTTEPEVRALMQRAEDLFPPEVKTRWQEYWETNADETGGFVRPESPDDALPWGNDYAANFPRIMSKFLDSELGNVPPEAARRNVADAKAEVARWEKLVSAPSVIRFADADTVAKVEGWPDSRARAETAIKSGEESVASHRSGVEALEAIKRGEEPRDEYYASLKIADPTGFRSMLKGLDEELESARIGLKEAEDRLAKTKEAWDQPRFSPEHQGIYDRYAKDVTKFLKQLGGKHITDESGHGWWEIPIADNPKLPRGGRIAMGSANTEIMATAAAIGGGAALGAWLADEESKLKGAITGGITGAGLAILGLSRLAKSPSPAIRDSVAAVGRAAEYTLGTLSTRIRGMSESVLRRLDQFEKSTLVTAHDALVKMEPFVAGVGKLKSDSALSAAILSNNPVKIAAELGRLGKPELIQAFREVRAQLDKYGEALRENKLLKGLRQDYFPRVVSDYEGLMQALGSETKTIIERRIADADLKSVRHTGAGLTPLEISAVVNEYLAQQPQAGGKSRFLRERKIGEISPELAKFYAPPAEGLMLYARAAAREIEKAKFFGKHLVRDATDRRIDVQASIGNLLLEEQARGKVKPEDFAKLQNLLNSRFGPGERAMAVPLQNLRNWSNAMLLGHVTSAVVQFGDVAMSVPLHGLLPTIKSLRQVLTRSPDRISVTDLGLVDHVIEEFSGTLASAKALDKVFKFSGFSLVDQLGKSTLTNAAINKFRILAKSEVGRMKIAKQYGDYFGKDLGGLIEELRVGTKGPLSLELAFRELADAQPITKIEVPQAYLDNPNARVAYQLKTFAIKQMDLARRKVWQQLRGGNPAEGIKNALRIGATLALAGAGADMIRDFILGRERERDWGDLPLNLLKTYGMSSYMMDKIRQGKGYETLIMSTIAPPWKIFEQVYHADPRVLENTPIIGKFLYWRLMGGAEAWNEKEEKRQLKEDRQSE